MPPSPAAAPAVTIVDTPPPAPPPKPTQTINVSQMTPPPAGTPPPKAGTHRDKMFEDLRKRAKTPGASDTPPADTNRPGALETPPPEGQEGEGQTPPEGQAGEGEGQTPPEGQAAADKGKAAAKPKVNPWKLADQYKARVSELEKELADTKTTGLGEAARKQYLDQIEAVQKENQRLEDEIRFVNYAQSKEFKEKHQAPYEAAWKRATAELAEIPVTDAATGATRSANPDDLLALVNMPLGQALEAAKQTFGDYAEYVMGHRQKIRELFDAQSQALDEAKKTGAERAKQKTEMNQKRFADLQGEIRNTWDKANEYAAKHEVYGKFFGPVEGDTEGNAALDKGLKLVDQAFGENPMNPNLTPEQRAQVVKRHAAVRYRAAAFPRLHKAYTKLQAEVEALQKDLAKYQASTPPIGGGQPQSAGGNGGSARDQVLAELRKRAK